MLLFTAEMPPIKTPLISIVTELKVEEPVPITWKDNPNKCTDNEWIAKEAPFYCIVKPQPVYTPKTAQNTAKTIVRGSNAPNGWYPRGQCTFWVWSQRSVGQWNDASDWMWQAQRDGWSTGNAPKVGAIAWQYGHVALVESVNGATVSISEMNYVGFNVVSRRTVPVSTFKYIY